LGDPVIDGALPWGGLKRAALHEIVGHEALGGVAAVGFAAGLLGRAAGADGVTLWCRRARAGQESGLLYGPGLGCYGLASDRLILVEAATPAALLWAMEEGLRCRRLAGVLGEVAELDLGATRRLALAAAAGGAIGLLLRHSAGQGGPSAAVTRWRIAAAAADCWADRWDAELVRCRGGVPAAWRLGWDNETLRFRVVALLAGGAAGADGAVA
jgi:protein ImuA